MSCYANINNVAVNVNSIILPVELVVEETYLRLSKYSVMRVVLRMTEAAKDGSMWRTCPGAAVTEENVISVYQINRFADRAKALATLIEWLVNAGDDDFIVFH